LGDAEREDNLHHSEIEITDLDPSRRSNLASAIWQYSKGHRLQVRVFKVIVMCLGVFILAIVVVPSWLAQLSRNATPATSAHATSSSTESVACSESSSIVIVFASSDQSRGSTINVPSAMGETTNWSTTVNHRSGSCVQGNEAGTLFGSNGILHRPRVKVRILHKLSGGGSEIQWYSVR
jgi:hypothetical protein